jgi:hypothetical protein
LKLDHVGEVLLCASLLPRNTFFASSNVEIIDIDPLLRMLEILKLRIVREETMMTLDPRNISTYISALCRMGLIRSFYTKDISNFDKWITARIEDFNLYDTISLLGGFAGDLESQLYFPDFIEALLKNLIPLCRSKARSQQIMPLMKSLKMLRVGDKEILKAVGKMIK